MAIGLPLAILSLVVMGSLAPTLGEGLRAALFGWVPGWAVMDKTADLGGLSDGAKVALAVLGLLGATLAGGFTQELYARGFLLPRTTGLGRLTPIFNAAAFAVLHLVSPWSWPVFLLVALPWAVVVWWKRSTALGLAGHVGMLSVMWLAMVASLTLGAG